MNEGQPQNLPIGIVDLDNTATTRKLERTLDAFPSTKIVKRYSDVSEARSAMQHNEIYGFLLFPEGTTDKLLSARRPDISLYYSNTSLTAGSLVFKDLKTISLLGSAAVGSSTMSAKGYTQEQINSFLQPIALDFHAVNNPWVNYNIYLSTTLVPGTFFLGQALVVDEPQSLIFLNGHQDLMAGTASLLRHESFAYGKTSYSFRFIRSGHKFSFLLLTYVYYNMLLAYVNNQ